MCDDRDTGDLLLSQERGHICHALGRAGNRLDVEMGDVGTDSVRVYEPDIRFPVSTSPV